VRDGRRLGGGTLTIHCWAKDGRRLARVCKVDKLEELVTEGGMISNVDQCAIKDWYARRVSDGWHRVERARDGEREQTHTQGSGE
jgi:hypothetical protein